MLQEMTDEKARHLLALSREMRWSFPSSQGTPIIKGHAATQWTELAVKERESYVKATRTLMENGDEEASIEMAANAWRQAAGHGGELANLADRIRDGDGIGGDNLLNTGTSCHGCLGRNLHSSGYRSELRLLPANLQYLLNRHASLLSDNLPSPPLQVRCISLPDDVRGRDHAERYRFSLHLFH